MEQTDETGNPKVTANDRHAGGKGSTPPPGRMISETQITPARYAETAEAARALKW